MTKGVRFTSITTTGPLSMTGMITPWGGDAMLSSPVWVRGLEVRKSVLKCDGRARTQKVELLLFVAVSHISSCKKSTVACGHKPGTINALECCSGSVA